MFFRRKGTKPKPKKVFLYKDINMASKQETIFAAAMDAQGIPWEYEPEKLRWVPPKRTYTPDFKVTRKDGSHFLIEYKGYLRPEDRTKMSAIRKQYPELDIRIIFSNAQNRISKIRDTTYAAWADKNGFIWAEKVIPREWLKEKGE